MGTRMTGLRSISLCLAVTGILFLGLILFTGVAMAQKKPDFIRIADIHDLSGPYAQATVPMSHATQDAWDYINTELNGVHGVKGEPIVFDMKGKTDLGLTIYNNVITMKPKPLFMMSGVGGLAAALRERFKEDGIVAIVPGPMEAFYPVANSFSCYPTYPDQFAAGVKYLKDNWKGTRKMRIGILTVDNPFGRSFLTNEFLSYVKDIGVDVAGTEFFGVSEVDVTNQLLKLRQKEPDYLVCNTVGPWLVAVKKGCREMGWDIKVLNNSGQDWASIMLNPDLFDGDITLLNIKSWDEADDPAIKTLVKYFKKYNRTLKDRNFCFILGWQKELTAHKAMVEVVDKYGWEGLNAENLKKALCNMKDFRPLGGLTSVTYTADRPTLRAIRLYRVEKGEPVPKLIPLVKDFLECPDLRPSKR